MDEDTTKRININDLPRPEEELTNEEANEVTGGGGANFALGDGSVRNISILPIAGNTVGGALDSAKGNTIGGSLAGDVSNPVKP